MTGAQLAEQVTRRVTFALILSNLIGVAIVTVFLALVLPAPADLENPTTLLWLNVACVVAFFPISAVLGTWVSRRTWRPVRRWLESERPPTERERRLALRGPLRIQVVSAGTWMVAALLFGGLNLGFSFELAGNVSLTIILGGIATTGVSYLLTERLQRPIWARALADDPPARLLVPGVQWRVLLTWAVGSGILLVGVLLVAALALGGDRLSADRVAFSVLFLSITALVIGSMAMVGVARSIARPVNAVRRALAEIEEGNLDASVRVDDGTEIGLLPAGFNQMAAGLREREELRDLFGRHVGEDVVSRALERGVELGGEQRHAAVLFVDVIGSTAYAAAHDPAEVVGVLNRFFGVVVDVVRAHGGWINKFEGDAALCLFGVLTEHPDPARGALAAARELRDRLRTEITEVEAAIGVSVGDVVAGNIGAEDRFESTVIGDPVNEASRLTELAKGRESRLLASATAIAEADGAGGHAATAHWVLGEDVQLRGRTVTTQLAWPKSS